MWRNANVRLAVVGSGKRCSRLLETLSHVNGLELVCFLDPFQESASGQIAGDLDIPYDTSLESLTEEVHLDVVLDTTSDSAVQQRIQDFMPEGATLIMGNAARFVRLLTIASRRGERMADLYSVTRREYEQVKGPEQIVGKSPQILELQDLIAKVAPTPTTVLLLGETGTGKDLAARCIHQQSAYRNRPFVSVNCTALAPSLMESELFGYKRGAFTGAEQDRKGLIEEANGGTLFLDEIGDMQVELQAKLLRFLQTGEVRPVGSPQAKNVQVRVIAATNRNLEEAVDQDTFRRDLFYRFNTFSITIPPLRQRLEDVPYLAYHFLTKAEAKLNKKVQGIGDDAMARLQGYHWPGNVRELENVLERAVILCQNGAITPADLPLQIQDCRLQEPGLTDHAAPESPSQAATLSQSRTRSQQDEDFKTNRERVMAMFEKKELEQYIKQAEGNISKASRLSGIPRRTFYRLMRKHGI